MRRSELVRAVFVACASFASTGLALAADTAPLRWSAPIEVTQRAPFMQLPLTPAAYARIEQPGLADLRIVDAAGERVPFAILAPRSDLRASDQVREVVLYPLPARPNAAGTWTSPVDVVVQGDRIEVRRRAGPPPSDTTATSMGAAGTSGGWLVDLGAVPPGEGAARSLRLVWSGPAEFTAAYAIETSDDLRIWRPAGAGQLMALQSPAGALVQDVAPLPEGGSRFVRLVWAEPGTAPVVTGARSFSREQHLVALDSAAELTIGAGTEPVSKAGTDAAVKDALHFDLGGALPIVDIDLRWSAGTHVAPVRLQGRAGIDEPWRELGGGVFYRLERVGVASESPAIALGGTDGPTVVRYLRVVPDERAARVAAADVKLVVHAQLARLVFAAQGQPPYRLLAGSRDAAAGALPASTLVPAIETERARFGSATLESFTEIASAVQEIDRASRDAQWRPWLLWAVLLLGVAGLGTLVFRLARSSAPPA